MRGSTAAGINNSLLPRDCSCGEFADGAIQEEASFWCLLDFRWCYTGKGFFSLAFVWICRWCYTGRCLFFLVFVGFPVVLSGEETFFPGICEEFADGAIREEASFPWHLWHSAHSVPETPSCGTEYARGAQNSLLWYATHFQGHSVHENPNAFLWTLGARRSPVCFPPCQRKEIADS